MVNINKLTGTTNEKLPIEKPATHLPTNNIMIILVGSWSLQKYHEQAIVAHPKADGTQANSSVILRPSLSDMGPVINPATNAPIVRIPYKQYGN